MSYELLSRLPGQATNESPRATFGDHLRRRPSRLLRRVAVEGERRGVSWPFAGRLARDAGHVLGRLVARQPR